MSIDYIKTTSLNKQKQSKAKNNKGKKSRMVIMVTIMTYRWIYTLLGTVQSNNYTKKSWGEYTDCACVRARRTGKTLTDCMYVCARVRACVRACMRARRTGKTHRLRVCVRACVPVVQKTLSELPRGVSQYRVRERWPERNAD